MFSRRPARRTARALGSLAVAGGAVLLAGCIGPWYSTSAQRAERTASVKETQTNTSEQPGGARADVKRVEKTDAEWKETLSPEQYRVLRQAGTERPYSGQYWNHHENGTYTCAGCGAELFRSNEKFDSGCGWPSFYDALDKSKIVEREDRSHGMVRTEVLCKQCGGHLGHVFEDGPQPTGLRYCINSASLDFEKKDDQQETK